MLSWLCCWANSGCSYAVGVCLVEAVMVLVVVAVLAGGSVANVVLSHSIVAFIVSVVISIVVSSIICVCLVLWTLIFLSTLVRTLFLVVGGGTNLSLCASL